uniref:Uncharacterized protein n=1 Tax=Rhizophora mucronata TaxID=61149 RepID=A0A2P2NVM2_RHIMU
MPRGKIGSICSYQCLQDSNWKSGIFVKISRRMRDD